MRGVEDGEQQTPRGGLAPRGSKARSRGGVQKSPVTASRGVGSVRCADLRVGEPPDVSRSRGTAQGVSAKGCTNLSV